MPLSFVPSRDIFASDLFDGRLNKFDIQEKHAARIDGQKRYLSDAYGSLTVYIDNQGRVIELVNYGFSDPVNILCSIQKALKVRLRSEQEAASVAKTSRCVNKGRNVSVQKVARRQKRKCGSGYR
jgi:hypothetical protein